MREEEQEPRGQRHGWKTDRTDSRTIQKTPGPQNEVPRTDSQQARPGSPPRNRADSFLGFPHEIPNDSTLGGPSAFPTKVTPLWLTGSEGPAPHCSADSPLPGQETPPLLHSPLNPGEGPPPLPVAEETKACHTQLALTHTVTGVVRAGAAAWHSCPQLSQALSLSLLTPS